MHVDVTYIILVIRLNKLVALLAPYVTIGLFAGNNLFSILGLPMKLKIILLIHKSEFICKYCSALHAT